MDHCAVNAVLYGPRGKKWAMTERPRSHVQRTCDGVAIGSSAISWDGSMLNIELSEVTAPLPSRIRGSVRVRPAGLSDTHYGLDPQGQHHWWPISPCAQVEVELEQPALRWSGGGYLDSNWGEVALEDSFTGWNWSRAKIGGDTAVLYDAVPRQGDPGLIALRFSPSGGVEAFDAPPNCGLPATGWRVRRETRADEGYAAKVQRTLEDAPFYSRSVLSTRILGEQGIAIHESLSMDRFVNPLVQAMLPFRMPRWPL